MTLLVDLANAPCHCTDHALDELYKAMAETPSADDDLLWRRHENPWIAEHLESVTARAQAVLEPLERDLLEWLETGASGSVMVKAWDSEDYQRADQRLRSVPSSEWTPRDWLLAVDWLFQKYLPQQTVDQEAEYLAVRSTLAGKLQAAAATAVAVTASWAQKVPAFLGAVKRLAWVTPRDVVRLQFAKLRAAELVQDVTDRTRSRIRRRIVEHEERKVLGDPVTAATLQTQLRDEFATMNRDWRRVAITECGRNTNESLLGSLRPGDRVKRVEAYRGACPFCAKINGMTFDVVAPEHEPKDGWSQVWVGKTNEGRSASPRKRVGNQLIEREDAELWWPAAGVQHPHCRGAWSVVQAPQAGADPEFLRWMRAELAKVQP